MKTFYDKIVPSVVKKVIGKYGGNPTTVPVEGTSQFGFDITPQMREHLTTKGQPLFAKGGTVKAADGGSIRTLAAKYAKGAQYQLNFADGGSVMQKELERVKQIVGVS